MLVERSKIARRPDGKVGGGNLRSQRLPVGEQGGEIGFGPGAGAFDHQRLERERRAGPLALVGVAFDCVVKADVAVPVEDGNAVEGQVLFQPIDDCWPAQGGGGKKRPADVQDRPVTRCQRREASVQRAKPAFLDRSGERQAFDTVAQLAQGQRKSRDVARQSPLPQDMSAVSDSDICKALAMGRTLGCGIGFQQRLGALGADMKFGKGCNQRVRNDALRDIRPKISLKLGDAICLAAALMADDEDTSGRGLPTAANRERRKDAIGVDRIPIWIAVGLV